MPDVSAIYLMSLDFIAFLGILYTFDDYICTKDSQIMNLMNKEIIFLFAFY